MIYPTIPALIADITGNAFGRVLVRHPRAARVLLRGMERVGIRGAGWALLMLDCIEHESSKP